MLNAIVACLLAVLLLIGDAESFELQRMERGENKASHQEPPDVPFVLNRYNQNRYLKKSYIHSTVSRFDEEKLCNALKSKNRETFPANHFSPHLFYR